jgi:hypothetical protein
VNRFPEQISTDFIDPTIMGFIVELQNQMLVTGDYEEEHLAFIEKVLSKIPYELTDLSCRIGLSVLHYYLNRNLIKKKGVQQDALNSENTIMIPKTDLKSRILGERVFDVNNPCSRFTIEYLPGDLKLYAQALLDTCPAHPVIVISSLFASLSALFGRRIRYSRVPSDEYQNIASLWIFIISESGSFKSLGLNHGHRLVKKYEKSIYENIENIKEHAISEDDIETEKKILQEKRKLIDAPVYSSSAARIRSAYDQDISLVKASELSGFLGDLRQKYNCTGKQQLINMFDGESLFYETKNGGKLKITDPFFSVVGASTESFLTNDISHVDISTGFLNRPLLYRLPNEDPYPEDDDYIIEDKTDIKKLYKYENAVYHIIESFESTEFRLSSKAKEIGRYIKNEILHKNMRQYDPQGTFKAFIKRWMTNIEKLAAIFQPFISYRDHRLPHACDEISEEAFLIAYTFVEPAIESTINLFEEVFVADDLGEKAEKVLKFIRDKYKKTFIPIKYRTIQQAQHKRFKDKPENFNRCLTLLEDRGEIEQVDMKVRAKFFKPIGIYPDE